MVWIIVFFARSLAFDLRRIDVKPVRSGAKIKTVTEFLTLRELASQFSEVVGEKASLALEMTPEQFEASRFVDHPAAELMYLSWDYVRRAGPDSGVRVRWFFPLRMAQI